MKKVIPKDEEQSYIKKKSKNYTKAKKVLCDWTEYRMLNFFDTHVMVVDEIHDIVSFKQSKWFWMCISFKTQNRNKAENEFKMTSENYLITQFIEKQ